MEHSKLGGNLASVLDSNVLPSLKHDTSSAPRMLTPYEIDWLREDKRKTLEAGKSIMQSVLDQAGRMAA